MAFSNTNKSSAPVFQDTLRKGRATIIADVQNLTFNDPMFSDGQLVKDVTFDQLVDTVWTNNNKSASPTFTETVRN